MLRYQFLPAMEAKQVHNRIYVAYYAYEYMFYPHYIKCKQLYDTNLPKQCTFEI